MRATPLTAAHEGGEVPISERLATQLGDGFLLACPRRVSLDIGNVSSPCALRRSRPRYHER